MLSYEPKLEVRMFILYVHDCIKQLKLGVS